MMTGYTTDELAEIRVAVCGWLQGLDALAADFTLPRSERAAYNAHAAVCASALDKLNREVVK